MTIPSIITEEDLLSAFLQYLEEQEASKHKSLDFIMKDLEMIVRTKDFVQRQLDAIDFWENV